MSPFGLGMGGGTSVPHNEEGVVKSGADGGSQTVLRTAESKSVFRVERVCCMMRGELTCCQAGSPLNNMAISVSNPGRATLTDR